MPDVAAMYAQSLSESTKSQHPATPLPLVGEGWGRGQAQREFEREASDTMYNL